jgi:adenosyl cobinamide kinase/adenosyl cobinamide phosphate guanylyltransferase
LENWHDFQKWWGLNSRYYLDKIQSRINNEQKNLTKNWNFCENNKQLLQQYYYESNLLIDCLNNSNVSNIIRKEIEDNLLLPNAEIEKRKRENIE